MWFRVQRPVQAAQRAGAAQELRLGTGRQPFAVRCLQKERFTITPRPVRRRLYPIVDVLMPISFLQPILTFALVWSNGWEKWNAAYWCAALNPPAVSWGFSAACQTQLDLPCCVPSRFTAPHRLETVLATHEDVLSDAITKNFFLLSPVDGHFAPLSRSMNTQCLRSSPVNRGFTLLVPHRDSLVVSAPLLMASRAAVWACMHYILWRIQRLEAIAGGADDDADLLRHNARESTQPVVEVMSVFRKAIAGDGHDNAKFWRRMARGCMQRPMLVQWCV